MSPVSIIEYCKLFLRAKRYKVNDEHGIINYIQNSIKPGDTVIDIGSNQRDYIFFILKNLKWTGKLIIFPFQRTPDNYLSTLKHKWNNVIIESIRLSNSSFEKITYIKNRCHTRSGTQAAIINLNLRTNMRFKTSVKAVTLDDYCMSDDIQPGFLKIDAPGYSLKILQGGCRTLKNHKPKILIRCDEKEMGREQVIETFNFLTGLNYSGYFILDTIRIPLINFDFNVYQNLCNDFYCNYFMFE